MRLEVYCYAIRSGAKVSASWHFDHKMSSLSVGFAYQHCLLAE